MPGPRPKPTALKRLMGNPGNLRLNDDAQLPRADDLTPPFDLYGEAQAEWQRVAPVLRELGLLTELDKTTLAAYCDAWGRYVEASVLVREHGPLVEGYRGSLVKNPAAQLARDALADAMRIATEFGMTPSSRGRLHIPGTDETDPDHDGILS